VRIEPEWLKEHTEKVELEFASPKVCDNPHGACSQLFKEEPVGWLWRIDNARWFSNRSDHCNTGSSYEFGGKIMIHGAEVQITESPYMFVTLFNCIDGCAEIMKMWNGSPYPTIIYNESIEKWIVEDISINDFKRDVKAVWDYMGTENSQYKEMVIFEEVIHAYAQMENIAHWFYGRYLNAQNVFNKLRAHSKLLSADDPDYLREHLDYYFSFLKITEEEILYSDTTHEVICALEKEAKHAAKSSHFGTYHCTYVVHGFCEE
jgi:hypothetical protein